MLSRETLALAGTNRSVVFAEYGCGASYHLVSGTYLSEGYILRMGLSISKESITSSGDRIHSSGRKLEGRM